MTPDQDPSPPLPARILLLASVFVVAACGLVYELVAGAVSSYLMGDAVTQYSLVIGVFLSAMGVGSYLAKFVRRRLLETFVEVEIWIGLLGGLSSILMLAVNAFAEPLFPVLFYALCAGIGALVGVEIPLLVRILKQSGGLSQALSNVLALDYLGALAGAIVFPLVALPLLGISRASVVFGLLNLVIAAAAIGILPGRRAWLVARLVGALVVLSVAFVWSTRVVGMLEDLVYQDEVVFARDTPYQRIILTRWRDDVRLYLNGHIQFSSVDEHRYHEALIIPVMELVREPRHILVLGGGDGLATREILKYESVESVTVVDIDPVMTELARTRRELLAINNDAFSSPKVRVVNQDAMHFLRMDQGLYDVIVCDLPDPSSMTLAKLYSEAAYTMARRLLAPSGALVTQATSPFYAPQAFWCIVATIEAAGAHGPTAEPMSAIPYHVDVPSFGQWGFVLAANHPFDPTRLEPSVPTRFLNPGALTAMFAFGNDLARPQDVEVNRLENPVLHRYYEYGWRSYNE